MVKTEKETDAVDKRDVEDDNKDDKGKMPKEVVRTNCRVHVPLPERRVGPFLKRRQ